MSISESTLSVAICDQFAFYPFRALVAGGVTSWETLDQAEQFVRTVLLHDYVEIDGEPMPSPKEEPEWTEEQIAAGARNVIVSFMPTLDGYEDIVHAQLGPTRELNLELPPHLVRLAASSAETDQVDNPSYGAKKRPRLGRCWSSLPSSLRLCRLRCRSSSSRSLAG